ncbi:MAG: DNA mismatch repair protein MutS [Phycisphaeraceae bacterium]|nr:DNA mismatch repair protein MutS [Phycisphaeraceae bacterium]
MPPSDPHTTPAMKQYHRFKQQHPGCVLFFRMGDFYEMFYDDAQLAHRVLGVTLTQRTKGIPMAGVPYHAVEGYLRRMIQAGYRVAVCDQIEDPALAKGVVDRDVTRVVTPGTLTDESLLADDQENALAAVSFPSDSEAAIAWAELSTGAFQVMLTPANQLADELARIKPGELLYCETADNQPPKRIATLAQRLGCPLTARPAWQFRQQEAVETLCKQYGVTQLSGFGFETNDQTLAPAGAVVAYLLETQCHAHLNRLAHLHPPRRFERHEHLMIDQASLHSLEVDRTIRTGETAGSLLGIFTECVTAMGKRLLRQWLCYPLRKREPIEQRHRVVAAMIEDTRFVTELGDAMDQVHDVPRILARLSVNRAAPRDLVALGRTCRCLRAIEHLLAERPAVTHLHAALVEHVEPIEQLGQLLAKACIETPPAHLREGGLIAEGYDAALDELRSLQRDSRSWLARYQKQLIEQTSIASLKIGYNKVFGYYIELSAANSRHVDDRPDDFRGWSRKQTLKNAERFVTGELKEFEQKVLSAESQAVAREQELFTDLCAAAAKQLTALQTCAAVIAALDVLRCFARRALRWRYVQPRMVDEPTLHITAGRHPVLDELLGDRFVPNDVQLGYRVSGVGSREEEQTRNPNPDTRYPTLALITGPNMAGKSTYIRQAALLTLLAHAGSFVPADEAIIGLTDRIFTRIGASDELHAGQSTFMVEMTEAANICHHATPASLVILDEIGRGTSTLDGLSLAWAIAEFLAVRGCRTLFATHYHELTQLAERFEAITNLNVLVREWQDEVVFLHKIAPGSTDRSYGIHVAKIAGLPPEVVKRANGLLKDLSVNHQGSAPPRVDNAAQMSLFTEYIEHPATTRLREMELDNLTPMQAFDLLRQLKEQLNDQGQG